MKKVIAFALPLLFFSLMSISLAKTTPVKVKRVKDVCFIRMRGDHHTQSFWFHYVNLSPEVQTVKLGGYVCEPNGSCAILLFPIPYTVPPGDSIEFSWTEGYRYIMGLSIFVNSELLGQVSVVIPPPP